MNDIIKNIMIKHTIRNNSIIQKIGDTSIIYKLSGNRKKKRASFNKNKRGGNGEEKSKDDKGDKDDKGKDDKGKDDKGKDNEGEGNEGEGEEGEGEEGEGEKGEGEKGEGDKSEGDPSKDANGKCVGEDKCAASDLVDKLKGPKKKIDSMDKIVKDKVNNVMKDAWTNLSDKAKCPLYAAEKIPDMMSNIVDKVGKSTAGAFDNVSNSIKNLFDQVSGQEIKGYPDIFGPFEVAYAFVITKIQNVINKIALGEDADKILASPEITSGELLDKIMKNSKMYKDLVKEAEIRDIFKDWMKNYTDALLETLDIAKPEIDRINTEINTIIEGMGDNVGESLSHALVNVVRSAVSNLPVVGGIVSAVLSADELGEEILNACRPPVAKGAGAILPVINGVNKQVDKTKCQINDLVKKIEPIMEKMEKKMNSVGEKMNKPAIQGGGVKTVKNIGKKINNSTRCLKYMLSRFSNKNITRRNKRFKNHKKSVKGIKV